MKEEQEKQSIRDGWKVTDQQHVLVVGPGLGRDDHMQSCARIAFELAKEMDQLGVVVDADGLWLVQVSPSIIGHAPCERVQD